MTGGHAACALLIRKAWSLPAVASPVSSEDLADKMRCVCVSLRVCVNIVFVCRHHSLIDGNITLREHWNQELLGSALSTEHVNVIFFFIFYFYFLCVWLYPEGLMGFTWTGKMPLHLTCWDGVVVIRKRGRARGSSEMKLLQWKC